MVKENKLLKETASTELFKTLKNSCLYATFPYIKMLTAVEQKYVCDIFYLFLI